MKKIIPTLFCTLICALNVLSQDLSFRFDKDSFLPKINDFIKNQEKLDTIFITQIYGLTNNYEYPFKNSEFDFKDGIYKFRTLVSHTLPYLFIKKSDTISIVKDYSLKNLSDIYYSDIDKNECKKNLIILENILDIVNKRQN